MDDRRNRSRRNWPNPWIWFFLLFWGVPTIFRVIGSLMPLVGIAVIVGLTFLVLSKVIYPQTDFQAFGRAVSSWFTTPIPVAENPEKVRLRELAAAAMARTGVQANDQQLRLDDIGILIYEGTTQPRIYRTAEVPTTASHIRPFIVLNQPYMQGSSGHGTVRFNLVDENGNLRYTNRARYRLKAGQNFITPPTWLPLNDQNPNGKWTLQVSAGDQDFALLDVDWLPVGGEARTQFNGDGEIDELTFRLMTNQAAEQTMSLDELLGDQGEETPIKIGASR